MKTTWLAAGVLMTVASAAHAANYGLLGATFGKGAVSPAMKEQIVSRATATLDRPPGAIPHAHTEGTLPGNANLHRHLLLRTKVFARAAARFILAGRLLLPAAFFFGSRMMCPTAVLEAGTV